MIRENIFAEEHPATRINPERRRDKIRRVEIAVEQFALKFPNLLRVDRVSRICQPTKVAATVKFAVSLAHIIGVIKNVEVLSAAQFFKMRRTCDADIGQVNNLRGFVPS